MQLCVTKLLLKPFYEFLHEAFNYCRLAWASLVKTYCHTKPVVGGSS